MNKKLQTIDTSVGKLLNTIKRFPIALFCAYLFTIILMTLATLTYQQKEALYYYPILNKIAFLASIGFLLFSTLRLISRNYLLIVLGFAILISYYIYLPDDIRNLHKLGIEYPVILFSLFSIMITAPYLIQSTSNIKFWNWAKHIIFSLLLSFILGFILFLGLIGGLYITKELFALEEVNQYSDLIGLFTVGIFGSYFFLSQLPKYPRLLPLKEYNNIEKIFTKFILTPLFILYFIILYTYTAKVVFLGEWPKGVVSISILLFSALSILTYLFWTPLWKKEHQKYKNFFWWTILIQTFVLAIALYLRVEPYGWTSSRYIIAVLGFWLFIMSVYFIIKKNASYRLIFISLPMLLMFTLFGPFSANTIAKQSQQERLVHLLSQDNNLSNDSNLSLRYNISSSIEYLSEKHGKESLFPIIPEIVSSFENREIDINDCSPTLYGNFPEYATQNLGFKYINRWQWEEHTRAINNKEFNITKKTTIFTRKSDYGRERNLNIKGYTWLISFGYFKQNSDFPQYCPAPNEPKSIKKPKYIIETAEKTITIKEKNSIVATIDLQTFMEKITHTKQEGKDKTLEEYYSRPIIFSKEEFTYQFNNSTLSIKIIFDTIEASEITGVTHYVGDILIKEK